MRSRLVTRLPELLLSIPFSQSNKAPGGSATARSQTGLSHIACLGYEKGDRGNFNKPNELFARVEAVATTCYAPRVTASSLI